MWAFFKGEREWPLQKLTLSRLPAKGGDPLFSDKAVGGGAAPVLRWAWINKLKEHTLSTPSNMAAATPEETVKQIAAAVIETLEDDKAEELLVIDLEGKSSIADQMIIASGRSQRHVAALAEHVTRRIKDDGLGSARVEGLPNADWVLIDTGDIIVHLFRPEVRAFYNLERIWGTEATDHRNSAN